MKTTRPGRCYRPGRRCEVRFWRARGWPGSAGLPRIELGWRPCGCGGEGALLDGHDAVHEHAVTWEGAKVGVKSWLGGSVEFKHLLLSGLDQLRVEEDVCALGNVTLGHAIRSGCHLHGGHHDFILHAGFAEDDVVGLGDGVSVFEGDFHFLADLDVEGLGVVFHACGAGGFDGEFESGCSLCW